MAPGRNQTQARLVEDERFHYCANPARHKLKLTNEKVV